MKTKKVTVTLPKDLGQLVVNVKVTRKMTNEEILDATIDAVNDAVTYLSRHKSNITTTMRLTVD